MKSLRKKITSQTFSFLISHQCYQTQNPWGRHLSLNIYDEISCFECLWWPLSCYNFLLYEKKKTMNPNRKNDLILIMAPETQDKALELSKHWSSDSTAARNESDEGTERKSQLRNKRRKQLTHNYHRMSDSRSAIAFWRRMTMGRIRAVRDIFPSQKKIKTLDREKFNSRYRLDWGKLWHKINQDRGKIKYSEWTSLEHPK